ncbi:MAG TPA: peptidoglycan-binding domain-containing protein, partial [Kofleriaceae bacterium]|nr:peptidoglycan-binding domain-containing protein [Kofleriaceae bacterium]
MAKQKKVWTAAALEAWAAREYPADYAPKPTVFNGGPTRMIALWEASRDNNLGGYGSGVTHSIRGWGKKSKSQVTSCSPFTATVIGMMFDARGGEAADTVYEPKFDDGQRALASTFYALHNGFYFSKPDPDEPDAPAIGPARKAWFEKNKWPTGLMTTANSSAGSLVFHNLGYEIDPRDMRRGDLIGINWANRGGHATFCWDVHLDASGAVDCFLFLSANGGKRSGGGYFGAGVSVGTASKSIGLFFDKAEKGNFKKKGTMFEDKADYIEHGHWECLPKIAKKKVDRTTFNGKAPPLGNIIDSSEPGGHSVESMRVIRFWGMPPPDAPHGTLLGDNADLARQHSQATKWQLAQPFAMGSAKPSEGRIENVEAKPVAKTEPDPVKVVPPAPAKQKKEQVVGHQMFVEQALGELFAAKWIAVDPGKPDSVADAKSRAAIEDFQAKFKVSGEPGQAGPSTRAALKQAIDDLHAGKPNPNKPDRKPVIEVFYWAANQVAPRGRCGLTVQGKNLDLVANYQVSFTDKASGVTKTVAVPIDASSGQGSEKVDLPAAFEAGSALSTKISGGGASKSTEALLYVTAPAAPAAAWPWDEAAWPASLRDVVKQLRGSGTGSGRFQPRRISQYGVWHDLPAGDTPVLDRAGRALGQVDRRALY